MFGNPKGKKKVSDPGSHSFFMCIFCRTFQEQKLRFSRTVVCGENALGGIEIMPKIFNSNFICTFSCFSFFHDFSRPGNLFFHF